MRERLQKDLGIINSFLGRLLVAIPLAILTVWFCEHYQLIHIGYWSSGWSGDGLIINVIALCGTWLFILWFSNVYIFNLRRADENQGTFGNWIKKQRTGWKSIIIFGLVAYMIFAINWIDTQLPNHGRIFYEDAIILVRQDIIDIAKSKSSGIIESSWELEDPLLHTYCEVYNHGCADNASLGGLKLKHIWRTDLAFSFLQLLSVYAMILSFLKVIHFFWKRKYADTELNERVTSQ